MNDNIIEFNKISIDYPLKNFTLRAVNNVSFNIKRGKITALVGESGSGKTTISSSIIRCISEPGIIADGEILFYSKDDRVYKISEMNEHELRKFRWEKVSMVFQAAQSALNPVMTVREHFFETLSEHGVVMSKKEKEEKCIKLLDYVKLDAKRVLDCYPHELSGGMKQRVMIAFSLLLNPEMIILDEPTTALDVITQSYIFNLLKEINRTMGITMLLMTHDISVVARFADYIGVMYGGRLMEYGNVIDVFKYKKHPYTRGLINATPSLLGDIDSVKPIKGSPPNMLCLPSGCVFSPRCDICKEKCKKQEPENHYGKDGSFVKCFFLDEENYLWKKKI